MAARLGNEADIFVGTSPDTESVLQIVSIRRPEHLVDVHFQSRVDSTYAALGG